MIPKFTKIPKQTLPGKQLTKSTLSTASKAFEPSEKEKEETKELKHTIEAKEVINAHLKEHRGKENLNANNMIQLIENSNPKILYKYLISKIFILTILLYYNKTK